MHSQCKLEYLVEANASAGAVSLAVVIDNHCDIGQLSVIHLALTEAPHSADLELHVGTVAADMQHTVSRTDVLADAVTHRAVT